MGNNLTMNQQCTLTTRKTSDILRFTGKNIGSRLREDNLLLYSGLMRLHLEYFVQVWVLCTREMDLLESDQWKTVRIRKQEHLC